MGTCHAVEVTYEPLDVPPVVECGDGHTGETAAVVDTGLPLDAAYPTEGDLDDDHLGAAFGDVRSYRTADEYVQARPIDQVYATSTQVLPTADQGAAGARWVACDVTYGDSSPEPVPGRLAGALQSADTAPHRACLTGDPAENDTVACSERHWAEEISGLPDVPVGTPCPTDRAAREVIAAQCLPEAVDHLDGPLPAGVALDITTEDADDRAGSPVPTCVLVPADGGPTTTSFRD